MSACRVCNATEVPLYHCGACLEALYCGKSCQASDWGDHALECTGDALSNPLKALELAALKAKNAARATKLKLGGGNRALLVKEAMLFLDYIEDVREKRDKKKAHQKLARLNEQLNGVRVQWKGDIDAVQRRHVALFNYLNTRFAGGDMSRAGAIAGIRNLVHRKEALANYVNCLVSYADKDSRITRDTCVKRALDYAETL